MDHMKHPGGNRRSDMVGPSYPLLWNVTPSLVPVQARPTPEKVLEAGNYACSLLIDRPTTRAPSGRVLSSCRSILVSLHDLNVCLAANRGNRAAPNDLLGERGWVGQCRSPFCTLMQFCIHTAGHVRGFARWGRYVPNLRNRDGGGMVEGGWVDG
jgi:hypothetical protein